MNNIFQPKRRKYNIKTLQFNAKRERYKMNKFIKNIVKEEEKDPDVKYNYYIRPFIPFWRVQQLDFETVNECHEIPGKNESKYPRHVLHDLVQTWTTENPQDKRWFDRKDIFELLKDDLALRIQSQVPTKSLRRL